MSGFSWILCSGTAPWNVSVNAHATILRKSRFSDAASPTKKPMAQIISIYRVPQDDFRV